MKQHSYFIIYKTVCKVTNRFYLGMHCTNNLDDGYLGSGTIIQHSIKKHGEEKHERVIIETCQSFEELCAREKAIITEDVLADPLCMNIRLGGNGGWSYVNSLTDVCAERTKKMRTAEYRAKRSQEQIDRWNNEQYKESFYQTVRSEEYKESRRIQMNEIYQNPALIEKVRTAKLGEKNPAFGKKWVYKGSMTTYAPKEEIEKFIADGWSLGRNNPNIGKRKKHASISS